MNRNHLWSNLLLLALAFILMATTPTAVNAAPTFERFEFRAQEDRILVVGETTNIDIQVFDEFGYPYSGVLTAQTVTSNGTVHYYTINGSGGSYTIQNVMFDSAGTYTLLIKDSSGNEDAGEITVLEAKIITDETLTLESENRITAKLVDSNGNPLPRRSVIVDGREVGGNLASYTTLSDGTFTLEISPTSPGAVNFVFSGHVVGNLAVSSTYQQERIGGDADGNSSLSLMLSQEGWSEADYVILTRDDMVADAMTAVPLSKKYDAPILMTSSQTLSTGVLDEIRRLGAENVLIIGGIGAISAEIETGLKASGMNVTRYAGADRYETAAKIALDLGASDTVYLAYGHGEADAIAASSFAAEQGVPILLSDKNNLPAVTEQALSILNPENIVILGGTGVISTQLENSLKQQYSVERYGGANRYLTEQIIFDNLYVPDSPVYFTSALVTPSDVNGKEPHADALLASALAAKNDGFVVALPPGSMSSLSTPPYSFLLKNKQTISAGTVIGNKNTISTTQEAQLEQLLMH